jgi:hypothetical protein
MLVALLFGGRLAEWTFALTATLFPVLLIALGTRRMLHRVRVTFLPVLGLVLGLSAAGVLYLSAGQREVAPIAGLPPATLWMLVGLGLVPLVLVTWVYSATFDAEHERQNSDG